MARILAFSGSTRTGSFNQRFVHLASSMARDAGGEVTEIDLRDFPMPIYDADLEASDGPPEHATELYDLMTSHHGLLISCPEFNSSITAVLKNAIDWVSRPREGDEPLAAFTGKVAALLSASPGALGGLRGLVHVRAILGNIGVIVLPNQVALSKAFEAFGDDGSLVDEGTSKRVAVLVGELVRVTTKLHG